ncbi:MAG: hypothetical protein MHM6MM_008922 [Cercozoa sp. M6MM]
MSPWHLALDVSLASVDACAFALGDASTEQDLPDAKDLRSKYERIEAVLRTQIDCDHLDGAGEQKIAICTDPS